MIYKMTDSKPRPKAVVSTLEDIDGIKEGGVMEIHVMQTNGAISRLFGREGKHDYVVSVREKDSNQVVNGPTVAAD